MEKEYKKILHEKNSIQSQLESTTEEKNLLENENNKILMENSNLKQMVMDITTQFEKCKCEISKLKLEAFENSSENLKRTVDDMETDEKDEIVLRYELDTLIKAHENLLNEFKSIKQLKVSIEQEKNRIVIKK